jgi:Caspase domain
MPIGLSIHVGLDAVDERHYGDALALNGPENDARSMADIGSSHGFQTVNLLTTGATAETVLDATRQAVGAVGSDGIVMLTFAGHGGVVPALGVDPTRPWGEPAWALYDRMLLRQELKTIWGRADRGSRILVIADSCHSGDPALYLRMLAAGSTTRAARAAQPNLRGGVRGIPADLMVQIYEAHSVYYQSIERGLPTSTLTRAGIIGIGACDDNEQALSDPDHGAFTTELLRAVGSGFSGTYRRLVDIVSVALWARPKKNPPPPYQHPTYRPEGSVTTVFEQQPAFTI